MVSVAVARFDAKIVSLHSVCKAVELLLEKKHFNYDESIQCRKKGNLL